MTRQDAYQILIVNLKSPNLIKHSLAAEAAMRGICTYLLQTPDEITLETWGITGLLHDADYEMTAGHPEQHGVTITEKVNLPAEIAYAIKAHNYQNTKVEPTSPMDWAIATCDQLTGLIVAATLVSPAKRLSGINTDFVLNRFGEKSFAKGADREVIKLCEEKLSIPLPKFAEIVLTSMQQISDELGL